MRQGRLCCRVWTLEPEFFVSHNTSLCRPVPCRSQIWLHWLPSSSSPWTHWLSLNWKGFVRVWIPCEEVFQYQAGTKAVGWWSGHDCCAGTLPWVRGCTSCLAIRSQRARGTNITLDWHAPSVYWFEDTRLWKTPTLFLASNRVIW